MAAYGMIISEEASMRMTWQKNMPASLMLQHAHGRLPGMVAAACVNEATQTLSVAEKLFHAQALRGAGESWYACAYFAMMVSLLAKVKIRGGITCGRFETEGAIFSEAEILR